MWKKRVNPAKISILPGDPPRDLEGVLGALFWKEPQMSFHAARFLGCVKEWQRTDSPYTVDQWKSYCERSGLTQSQYSNMLKRLRKAGMLDKRYNRARGKHELFLSEGFSCALSSMAGAWSRYVADY